MAQNKVKAITRTSLAGASLTASYQPVNTSGLPEACFLVRIYNTTSGAVDVSFDGSTDSDVMVANSYIEVSAQANAQPNGNVALFPKGLIVYVKGSAGAGNVYVSGYYVSQ